MKKMWVLLSLAMLCFASQSFAATFNLGFITNTQGFENRITSPVDVDQTFTDTWNFSTPSNMNTAAVSITNVAIKFGKSVLGSIKDFQAKLNGEVLELHEVNSGIALVKVLSGGYSLSQTNHVLEISGIVSKGNETSSYGGSIAVAQTPIPAAMWLFGSVLLGLFGIGRRKEIISA